MENFGATHHGEIALGPRDRITLRETYEDERARHGGIFTHALQVDLYEPIGEWDEDQWEAKSNYILFYGSRLGFQAAYHDARKMLREVGLYPGPFERSDELERKIPLTELWTQLLQEGL